MFIVCKVVLFIFGVFRVRFNFISFEFVIFFLGKNISF